MKLPSMSKKAPARHLYLVGGKGTTHEGPVTRLGLWYHFPPVSRFPLYFYAISKVLLLAFLIYWVYGV